MTALTQRQVDIITTLHALNLELARGNDDQRRELTRKIAEQFRYEFGSDWGTKSTTANHPPSKDAIAHRISGGLLEIWDWQNGESREPQVRAGQTPDHVEPHFFLEVNPINHLGATPIPGPPPDDDDDALVEILKSMDSKLKEIKENQTRLLLGQTAIMNAIQIIIDRPIPELPPINFPNYEANAWFGKITLKPIVANAKPSR